MEPNAAGSERTPEQLPKPIELGLAQPEHVFSVPERQIEVSPEISHERQVAATQATSSQPSTTSIPIPVSQPRDDQAVADPLASTAAPSTAADEDLIEKEWVDKAKQIIANTKDDPHAQEEQVGKLQADYLEKRYGKKLGSSE